MGDHPIKSIFEYDNYRNYLKDHYTQAKAANRNYSFGFMAKALGYSSPIFVKRIIDGSRNLTFDGILRFTRLLKLNKEEAVFFRHLVLFNQAKTEEERREHAQHIMRSRSYKKLLPLSEAQFRYYAEWYLVPVREIVGLSQFREDYQWIASNLSPPISSAQAKRAIEELLKLGLIKRNPSGKLVQTTSGVTTPDEIVSVFKADWMTELIKMGADSIKRIPREKRDLSSVTLGLSSEALEKIKEITKRFRKEVMEVAAQYRDFNDHVYQFNIQVFPLTKELEKK